MIADTISAAQACRFYDRLGAGHDRAERYEGRARRRGLELLDLQPGQPALNLGAGTGHDLRTMQAAVAPGQAVGLDLAPVMLNVARARSTALLCRGDARRLPFADQSFDRIFSSYLLDLIALADLPGLLADCRRVLRPGGRIVVVSLTSGVGPLSRTLIGAWELAYRVRPLLCGGCRPLQLAGLMTDAGLTVLAREVVVQLGMPSEVVLATRS